MSTFYLLPARPVLGERFARYLTTLFPGLEWTASIWPALAESLGSLAAQQPDVYVVYQEELPQGEDPLRALAEGFGAEAGDEVIELHPGSRPGELMAQRWRVGDTCPGACSAVQPGAKAG